jgi:RimJ/RimL family protein N-acetyltransferase
LRLLAIDARLAQALREGDEAFVRLTGARAVDLPTLLHDVVEPSLALLERVPRAAPFCCYLAQEVPTNEIVGMCGFKTGPVDGAVEIAYGTLTAHERRGIATAMAREMIELARASHDVRLVFAHTLPERNPSTSVLTKLGFEHRGAVEDPEDGTVWRWELPLSR